MSRLQGLRVYLSGPCEHAKGDGGNWRREITPKLKELGLIVLDPVNNPGKLSWGVSKQDEFNYVKQLKEKEDWAALSKCMKEVVHTDLRFVDCADVLIVQFDSDAPTTGTVDELCLAVGQKKPVYVCCKQGKKGIPLWIWGRIPPEYVYDSLGDIYLELLKISLSTSDRGIDMKRWLFLNNLGI